MRGRTRGPSLALLKPQARLEVGASDLGVELRCLGQRFVLTPEQAEELAVDLRSFALEVRNGGSLGGA